MVISTSKHLVYQKLVFCGNFYCYLITYSSKCTNALYKKGAVWEFSLLQMFQIQSVPGQTRGAGTFTADITQSTMAGRSSRYFYSRYY